MKLQSGETVLHEVLHEGGWASRTTAIWLHDGLTLRMWDRAPGGGWRIDPVVGLWLPLEAVTKLRAWLLAGPGRSAP